MVLTDYFESASQGSKKFGLGNADFPFHKPQCGAGSSPRQRVFRIRELRWRTAHPSDERAVITLATREDRPCKYALG